MKVLVTGGGGFVGQAVCRQLAARGDTPVAFQRGPAEALDGTGIEVRRGDITIREEVLAAVADCDAVIHTAGKAGAWGDPESYRAINVTGTEHVIDCCRRVGIGRLVFTSSPSVSGLRSGAHHRRHWRSGNLTSALITPPEIDRGLVWLVSCPRN